ncbi:hypothetical protein Droror1_Dr00015394 [Drosera rotundifolia]
MICVYCERGVRDDARIRSIGYNLPPAYFETKYSIQQQQKSIGSKRECVFNLEESGDCSEPERRGRRCEGGGKIGDDVVEEAVIGSIAGFRLRFANSSVRSQRSLKETLKISRVVQLAKLDGIVPERL